MVRLLNCGVITNEDNMVGQEGCAQDIQQFRRHLLAAGLDGNDDFHPSVQIGFNRYEHFRIRRRVLY